MFYSRIPQEIVDMIIDVVSQLPESEDTLKSCELVCKEWWLRSRKHLFSTITFMLPDDISRFLWRVKNPPNIEGFPLWYVPKLDTLVRHIRYGAPPEISVDDD